MQGPRKFSDIARSGLRNPLDHLFDKQRPAGESMVTPGSRTAMLCGRRGGKSECFAHAAIRVMQRRQGARVAYVALTRKSAMRIIWPVIRRLNERLKLGLVPRIQDGIWVAPNGSELHVMGANKADEVEKLRGVYWDLVGIDEPASFRASLLTYLISDVIDPSLVDYNGSLAVFGTPGAACVGPFYDLTTSGVGGWNVFRWTMLDNPHLPNPAGWLKKKRSQEGWDEDHPTYLREYLGKWVRDESALVYKFSRALNLVPAMPDGYQPGAKGWMHALGIDYGYVDATAWVAWAWRADASGDQRAWSVESFKWPNVPAEYLDGLDLDLSKGLLPEGSAAITERMCGRYIPWRSRGDAGGLGKPYVEHANRVYGLGILPAEKTEKLAQIEAMNGDLRTGRIQIVEGANRDYIEEMEILPWDIEKVETTVGGMVRHEMRRVIDQRYEDHLCDAGQYGHGDVRAYWNTHEPKPEVDPVYETPWGTLDPAQEAGRVAAQNASEWWEVE